MKFYKVNDNLKDVLKIAFSVRCRRKQRLWWWRS